MSRFFNIYEQEKTGKKKLPLVVTYGGRFQPPTKTHFDAYTELKKKFPESDVYITSSNKTDNTKSPFSFDEKNLIWKRMFDIDDNRILKVEQHYSIKTLEKYFDPDKFSWVVGVGEKDAERMSSNIYYKNILEVSNDELLKPFRELIYFYVIPLVVNTVDGRFVSGTMVREIFAGGSEEEKKRLFETMYGKFDQKIYDLLNSKLSAVTESYDIAEHVGLINEIKETIKE